MEWYLWQCKWFLFYCVVFCIFSEAHASEDFSIAEQLIVQNDCENALPILVSVWKSKSDIDQKKLLLIIKDCSEKTQNYNLKARAELLLARLDPANEKFHLDYVTSLFFLSKFKNVLSYTESRPQLKNNFDYWMLRARAHYELGQTEKAIEDLQGELNRGQSTKHAEIFYWLGQFYLAEQDYEQAIVFFMKSDSAAEKPEWLKRSIKDLIITTNEKNKKWRGFLRFRYGTDSNILREQTAKSDMTQFLDLSIDYDYLKKTKRSMTFGFDYNYQGYDNNSDQQTASFAPRLGQSFFISDGWSFDYLLSLGKVLTNNRADQNYLVAFSQLNYKTNSDFELQNAASYFANLNNNPVQQFAVSSILNIGLGSDFLWIGPVFKQSSSPEPLIDAFTYGYPVVTDFSLTTRYQQQGLLLGYLWGLSDAYSVQLQYSMNQTRYVDIDLSLYSPANVEGTGQRTDIYQSSKVSLKYRYSSSLRFEMSAGLTQNQSSGFQGFYLSEKPSNSYDQSQVLLGLSYRWP